MIHSVYNQKYLKTELRIIENELSDLTDWSTHNQDKNLDEIVEFKRAFEEFKEKLVI